MSQQEKSKEELLATPWENLTEEEKSLQYLLETYPELTLEEAKEHSESLP